MALKFVFTLAALLSVKLVLCDDDPIYQGCGTTKTCLGFPGDCLPTKDCVTFSSTFVKDGKRIFEMRSWKGAAYIAVGLSDDKRMGDDSVMECVKEGSDIKIYSSWTTIKDGNYGAPRDGVPQDIAKPVETKIIDDRIYCQVERSLNSKVKDVDFDLNTTEYFMLLASGSSLKENSVGYHDFAYKPSDKKISFKV